MGQTRLVVAVKANGREIDWLWDMTTESVPYQPETRPQASELLRALGLKWAGDE